LCQEHAGELSEIEPVHIKIETSEIPETCFEILPQSAPSLLPNNPVKDPWMSKLMSILWLIPGPQFTYDELVVRIQKIESASTQKKMNKYSFVDFLIDCRICIVRKDSQNDTNKAIVCIWELSVISCW
jgi:hypothetical protein